MSHNHGVSSTPPSRRSVVKGAAWAVPAVVVASAAPTVAASQGLLTLNGNACKLPGNSQSTFKGYVFELKGNNVLGPNPRDAVIVITGITVSDTPDLGVFKVVIPAGNPSCSCAGACALDPNTSFCTPDGTLNQQVLIYTSADVTGNSASSTVTVSYRVYDCNNLATCPAPGPVQTTSATLGGTPPVQGASCLIPGAEANQP
ncbi:hypothetical protein [Humibacillus xanthopallidus]|uniref:hypothetical protein n=1 Tax=Humibacillus xanthopallidus TaxID=412689 RepID=UPI00384B937A